MKETKRNRERFEKSSTEFKVDANRNQTVHQWIERHTQDTNARPGFFLEDSLSCTYATRAYTPRT